MIENIELFTRTLFMCFLMEIGSASNFTIAALANNSPKWVLILIAGGVGFIVADLLAIKFMSLLSKLPINTNMISGVIMVSVGCFFIWGAK